MIKIKNISFSMIFYLGLLSIALSVLTKGAWANNNKNNPPEHKEHRVPASRRSSTPALCQAEACKNTHSTVSKINELLKQQGITPQSFKKKTYSPDVTAVDFAQEEIKKLLTQIKPNQWQQDFDAILIVWGAVVAFDPNYLIARNNIDQLRPHLEKLYRHIKERQKSNFNGREQKIPVSKQNLDDIVLALSMAETEDSGQENDF